MDMKRMIIILISALLLSAVGNSSVYALGGGPKWKPAPSFELEKPAADQEGIKKAYWYAIAEKLEQMLIEKLSQQNCCIDSDSNVADPKKVKGSIYYIAWNFAKHKPKLAYSTDECTKVEGGKFLNEFTCKNFSCTQTSFENPKVFDNVLCGEKEKCIDGACVPKECYDTDGGPVFDSKGTVTEYDDNWNPKVGPIPDSCVSNSFSLLAEGICKKGSDGKLKFDVVYHNCCASGAECSGGMCVVPQIGDIDGDGLVGKCDNCPYQANPAQEDKDDDGVGDVCDDFKEPDVNNVEEGEYPSISADGRYVAFVSYSGLVPDDTNDKNDIYVRDLKEGITERVSISSNGVEADGWSGNPSISGDGRFVVFESDATNLVPNDTNGRRDIFIRDRKNGTTERVSVSNTGGNADDGSYDPFISANGRYVVFCSDAKNLVPNDTCWWSDVFLWDRISKTTTKISEFPGFEYIGDSKLPSLSWDGRFILFASTSSKKVDAKKVGVDDMIKSPTEKNIYIYDRLNSILETVCSDYCLEPNLYFQRPLIISLDGSHVAFHTMDVYISGDNNNSFDVFVYDRSTKTFQIESKSSSGAIGNQHSYSPEISGDGRYVVFNSWATNFTPLDNINGSLFIRDTISQKTTLISDETGCLFPYDTEEYNAQFSISADGRFVAYTKCYKVAFEDHRAIFVKDLKEGKEILVSVPYKK